MLLKGVGKQSPSSSVVGGVNQYKIIGGQFGNTIKNEMLMSFDPIIILLLGIHHREILLQLLKNVSVKGCLLEYLLLGKLERIQKHINSPLVKESRVGP